jgi:hypothetical protein
MHSTRTRDQVVDVLALESELEPIVQERARLVGGEAELLGAQLEQLPMCAYGRDRKCGLASARNNELERRWGPIGERGDALPRGAG